MTGDKTAADELKSGRVHAPTSPAAHATMRVVSVVIQYIHRGSRCILSAPVSPCPVLPPARVLHSSTFQLNLSRFCHSNTEPTPEPVLSLKYPVHFTAQPGPFWPLKY